MSKGWGGGGGCRGSVGRSVGGDVYIWAGGSHFIRSLQTEPVVYVAGHSGQSTQCGQPSESWKDRHQ